MHFSTPARLGGHLHSVRLDSRDTPGGDALPCDGIVAGSPAYFVDRLKQYLDVGVRHFLLSIPHVADTSTLRLVGEQVIPALKAG